MTRIKIIDNFIKIERPDGQISTSFFLKKDFQEVKDIFYDIEVAIKYYKKCWEDESIHSSDIVGSLIKTAAAKTQLLIFPFY